MAGDLEKFLQQAAERLAKKVAEGAQGKKPERRPVAQPLQRPAPVPNRPHAIDSEIVEAEVLPSSNRRELGPDPLSTIDTRPQLAQTIDQADERMQEHLDGVFDHQISHLRKASDALSTVSAGRQAPRDNASSRATEVKQRSTVANPLVAALSNPDTLRTAFVLSEIFARRF